MQETDAKQKISQESAEPFPSSRKIYIKGERHPDIRVPMREISLSGGNPPVHVYDTSGPYTDPQVKIDIRAGLEPLRLKWIEERGDTVELAQPSSAYGRARLSDAALAPLRFGHIRRPLQAKPGRNVTQMHYARQGV